jgi:hypothetical protein
MSVFVRWAYRPEIEEEVTRWLGSDATDSTVGLVRRALHTWGYSLSWMRNSKGRTELQLRRNGRKVSLAGRRRLITDAIRFAPTEAELQEEEEV